MRFPGATRHVEGFECKEDAERFLEDTKERLSEFGLNLHLDKTRLIEFGRHAIENRTGAQADSEADGTDTQTDRRGSAAKDKRQGRGHSAIAWQRSKGMAWVLRGANQLQVPAEVYLEA